MGSYILNFTVYTMAMCGLICFALFVYKKFATGCFSNKNTQFLNVEETLSLTPRKTLYVIKAGEERFLIASDADNTTLISKLETTNTIQNIPQTKTPQPVDLDSQLQKIYPKEQLSYKTRHQQQGHPQQIEYTGKTNYLEVEDFPQINTKKAKHSNDVIKNMVSRVKG